MADGLFGVPVGLRAFQDDQNKLRQLASQERSAAAQANLANAQARNLDVDNERQAAELQRKIKSDEEAVLLQRELARIAQGGDVEGGDTAAPLAGGSKFDSLLRKGERQIRFLIDTGRVAEASKMLPALTGGVKDLDQARQAASAAKKSEYDALVKRHDVVSRFMSGAVDQRTYDAARLQLQGSGVMTPEDMQELPRRYDPVYVKSVIAGTAAAKQKADLEREASRTATLNAGTRDEIANRKLVRDLEERRFKLASEREDRLEKQGEKRLIEGGDKPLPPASTRELDLVRGELKRLGVKAGDSQPDLVADIAEQVKTLVDSNPGLSRTEASARIVAEMRERGELEKTFFGGNRYKPKEGSLTMPLPTPKTAADLKKGNYYLDAEDGLVKLFDGKGFKVSTRRRRTDVEGSK